MLYFLNFGNYNSMNYFQFKKIFPTEFKAIRYFTKLRYGKEMVCPHCGSHKIILHSKNKFYICKDCNNTFSIFKNTIFEKSTTDLRLWFYAINLFLNAKKGISACQLQREIGVTYKTAWRMLKQIRIAIGNESLKEFINTIIEIDETYVGGKPRKENKVNPDGTLKLKNKRGRGTKKTPVVGTIDRINKKIHCKVALPNENNVALSGRQLLEILEEVCKRENIIVTDEFKGYNILEKANYEHYVVNHNYQYANGKIHTNNIESFWATLKRGVIGIYHRISVKYLQSYVNEFCFRYNNRNENMFDILLKQAVLV